MTAITAAAGDLEPVLLKNVVLTSTAPGRLRPASPPGRRPSIPCGPDKGSPRDQARRADRWETHLEREPGWLAWCVAFAGPGQTGVQKSWVEGRWRDFDVNFLRPGDRLCVSW